MRKQNDTHHHIVPSSRGGSNYYKNIEIIPLNIHTSFHRIFLNQTPPEQIQTLLRINSNALTADFRGRIERVLQESKEYTYNNGVLTKK